MRRVICVVIVWAGLAASGALAREAAPHAGSAMPIEQARAASLEHLRGVAGRHGIGRVEELRVERESTDEQGMTHTRVRQTLRGVPVFGGEAIVHLRADGSLFAVTDDLLTGVEGETAPLVDREHAVDLAVRAYGALGGLTEPPEADLWVLRHEGRDRLVYRVRLRREDGSGETSLPVIFIDARTGEEAWRYDDLQTATGSGRSLYSGSVSVGTYYRSSNALYYLEDVSRGVGTFDMRGVTSYTYRFTDADDVWDASGQRAGIDAHYGAAKVYDYYLSVHGRRGLDGSGGPGYYTSMDGVTKLITSKVHYGSGYNNAFWDGRFMTYGDGDGTTFSPLVTLDIAGHEMTHGVTEKTANLTYAGEPGALNESMSDVFGAMVERYARGESAQTWWIGEDAYTPGIAGDALRYMNDAHRGDQPDHYSERYTGTADNGGVHTNSGIANYVFYLLAKGGTHHLGGSMTGIGADAAARIWYKALTAFMTSGTDFAGARTATLNAATALYGSGSAQQAAVAKAWSLCGVGPSGGSELVVNGGFEGSLSPWVGSGNAYYTASGSYPHAGTGYAYLGYVNNASGTLYQSIAVASGAAPGLSFWLNVVSNETGTTAHDTLAVEVRSSSGALLSTLATYSNLNKAAAGAYSLKGPFDLSAWAGQTIRVQFRAATDSAYVTTFRVDDVSVR